MPKKLTIQVKVAKVIRKRREALGVSQEGFTEDIGVHRTYYGAIERGSKDVRLSTLERVCEFQCPICLKMPKHMCETGVADHCFE